MHSDTPQAAAVKLTVIEQLSTPARESLRFLFAALLTVTGIAKLLDMTGFYEVVRSYETLPELVIPTAAWLLSVGELVLAGWLVSRYRGRTAAMVLILLHVMYLGWLLAALGRGLELSNCGCFGVYWARPLTWFSPLEDLALVLLALIYWRLQPQGAT